MPSKYAGVGEAGPIQRKLVNNRKGRTMTEKTAEKTQDYRPLSREELNELAGEELPERAAMSLINANVAAPINAALALNVLSDNSVAYANAEQTADIDQSN
jgi:hypothetical protein